MTSDYEDDIEARIAAIVSRMKSVPPPKRDESLVRGGLLDSVDVEELAWEIERLCGREIGPRDVTLENFDTVARMAALARHRLRDG